MSYSVATMINDADAEKGPSSQASQGVPCATVIDLLSSIHSLLEYFLVPTGIKNNIVQVILIVVLKFQRFQSQSQTDHLIKN